MTILSHKTSRWFKCSILLLYLLVGLAHASELNKSLTPVQGTSVEGCYLEHYEKADNNLYILPFEVDKEYRVSQGNCGWITHQPECSSISPNGIKKLCGDLRYAYDFAIPIGDKIVAARDGTVVNVEEQFSNLDYANGQENFVAIEHDDGSVASYAHLSPNGALVENGAKVKQGQIIGIAGNSGYTGGAPHLHFQVLVPPFDKCTPEEYSGCKTIPVLFRNADPVHKPLLEGKRYRALEYRF